MQQPLQVAPWPPANLGTTRYDGLTKVEPAKPRTLLNPGNKLSEQQGMRVPPTGRTP